MSDNNGIVRNFGIIGLSNILTGISAFLILPVVTRGLSSGDYGSWIQITVVITLVPLIVMLGLPSAMVRFLAAERNRANISDCFYSMLAVTSVTSAAFSLLLFVFSGDLARLFFDGKTDVISLVSLIVFFECMSLLFMTYFRSLLKIRTYAAFGLLKLYLNLAAVAFMVLDGRGLTGAVAGYLATDVLICTVMLLLIVSEAGVRVPTFRHLRSYCRFGLPTVPATISGWVIGSSDRFVIGGLLGTSFVGYYSTGYLLGNIISMFIAPLTFLLPSVLSKYYDENHMARVRFTMERSLKYFLLIAIPSIAGISLMARPMLEVLSTPEIAANGYIVAPLVAVNMMLIGVASIYSNVLLLEKNTRVIGKVWIAGAIVYFPLNLLMVPVLGITGTAISLLSVTTMMLVAFWYYSRRLIPFSVDLSSISKYVLSSVVMSVPILMIRPEGLRGIAVAVLAGISVYFLSLLLLGGVRREEIGLLRQMIKY